MGKRLFYLLVALSAMPGLLAGAVRSNAPAALAAEIQATIPPIVVTGNVTNITPTSATLWGRLISPGTAPSVNSSFEWGFTSGNYTYETLLTSFNGSDGPFISVLRSLAANTTYHFRAKAMGDGTSYGEDMAFTTSPMSQTSAPPFLLKWGSAGSGDGQFQSLYSLAIDASGYVYVADYYNHRIQKFTTTGQFIMVWGSEGYGDGQLRYVHGIAADADGYVYVADTQNNRIQKFTSSGEFVNKWGSYGIGDGQFKTPYGLAVDSAGNIYVADTDNSRIQKFTSSGTLISKWGLQGSGDGQFLYPEAIAIDNLGNIFVADTGNSRIQKFTGSGAFVTKWGAYGSNDGQFWYPRGIAVDASGYVYVAEDQNHRIQKFTGSGTLIAKWGFEGTGEGEFQYPNGVAVDASCNVYVADTANSRVQVFATALQPSVANVRADNITSSSARLNGILDSWGTSGFVVSNFEWGTASGNYSNETIPMVWEDGATGNFSTSLTGLAPGTVYFFKAKAAGAGISYGVEQEFTTPQSVPAPNVEWSKTFGGVGEEMGVDVQQTTDGGYIIAGFKFYPDYNSSDIYLVKTDGSGNMTWSRTIGGAGADVPHSIRQTGDGGYIIGASTNSSSAGGNDALLIKTDASGNITWSRTFGGVGDEAADSVQPTPDGSYIFIGYTMSLGAGSSDVYLVKTDSSGNLTWSRTFGGAGDEYGFSIEPTPDGGYIIGAATAPSGPESQDAWLIKTDASGNMTWNYSFDRPGPAYAQAAYPAADGGYIFSGEESTGPNLYSVFLCKTDASGNLTWDRTYDTVGYGHSVSGQLTADGGFVIVGVSTDYPITDTDAWLMKTNASGNLTWSQTFGGPNWDMAESVQQTADGGYILGGRTMSFGAGGSDVWLIKLAPAGPLSLSVVTNNATNVTANSSRLNGTLTLFGITPNASVYFEWGFLPLSHSGYTGNMCASCHRPDLPPGPPPGAVPYTSNTTTQNKNTLGDFYFNLGGLSANTSYYYRARAVGENPPRGGDQTFTTLPPAIIPGDANGDGIVNSLDITKLERIIVGLDTSTTGADANLDGSINALDITKIERIIAHLD